MEIVNGYVCRNCSDVAMAKKNIDPVNPQAHQREEAQRLEAQQRQAQAPAKIDGLGRLADIVV